MRHATGSGYEYSYAHALCASAPHPSQHTDCWDSRDCRPDDLRLRGTLHRRHEGIVHALEQIVDHVRAVFRGFCANGRSWRGKGGLGGRVLRGSGKLPGILLTGVSRAAITIHWRSSPRADDTASSDDCGSAAFLPGDYLGTTCCSQHRDIR